MPGRKLRVLFIGSFPPPGTRRAGGVATSCRALVASRLAQDFDFDLVDSTARSVPPPSVGTRALDAASRFALIVWRLLRNRPDVMLVFASPGLSFVEKSLSVAVGRMLGVPSLLFLRGGEFMDQCAASPSYRRFAGVLLRAPTLLLCQGQTWQDFFQSTFGIPAERCPVIRNWTATPDLLRIGAGRTYQSRSPLSILFVGWLDDAKGLSELLDAFGQLVRAESPPCRLVLAGEGSASARARAWAADNGMSDRVQFLGWVDEEQRAAAFETADLFVLPSHIEGMPNALIEAMACGLPVISTPVGSVPDVIRNGVNGVLVPVKDSAALSAAIASLLAAPAERERLGRAAYESALTQFGLDEAVNRLSSAFNSVTTSRAVS